MLRPFARGLKEKSRMLGGGGVFSKHTHVANRLENLRIVKVCILKKNTFPPTPGKATLRRMLINCPREVGFLFKFCYLLHSCISFQVM